MPADPGDKPAVVWQATCAKKSRFDQGKVNLDFFVPKFLPYALHASERKATVSRVSIDTNWQAASFNGLKRIALERGSQITTDARRTIREQSQRLASLSLGVAFMPVIVEVPWSTEEFRYGEFYDEVEYSVLVRCTEGEPTTRDYPGSPPEFDFVSVKPITKSPDGRDESWAEAISEHVANYYQRDSDEWHRIIYRAGEIAFDQDNQDRE